MRSNSFFAFFFAICLTNCSVYTHQTVDIPLINKKKELRADGGISLKELFYGTLSYGLTDKIALQTYYNLSYDYRFFFQNAVGLYKDLGNRKILELYGGFGFGYTKAGNHDIPTRLTGHYQLYFTQLNFGKIDCKFANADFGFGAKVGFLHSNLGDLNYFTHYQSYYGPFETVPLIANSLLFEPIAFLRIGWEKLKFSLKLGSCLHYQLTHKDKQLPIDNLNLGLGLNFLF